MATIVLSDGRLMEEARFRRLHLLILGVFLGYTEECHELVRFCLRKGKFAKLRASESDLGESTRKVLRKSGLMVMKQGLSLVQPDGEHIIYVHEIIPDDVRSVLLTLITWRESTLHLVDVILPEIEPNYRELDLIA